jgi:acetyl esterase/lipase
MKNILRIILLICITVSAINAQDTIHLWPGNVPGCDKPKAASVVSEKKDRNVTRLKEVTDPLMRVYQPKNPNGVGIVVCPGGGYWILAIDLEGDEVAQWLSKLGYTAFVLEYRVPDKKAEALMDAQRAMRLVRANAKKYGLDKDKIGIMGFSAGGSLSARTSTLYNEKTYEKVDENDENSCQPNFAALIYPAYLDKGENRSLTPELKVDSLTCPMYLFATADDKHGNSALVMAGALRDAKVPVELHFYPEGGHGYGLRSDKAVGEIWPALMEKWLENHLLEK